MVIHHIRWVIETNKMKQPNHELAPKLFKLPIYSGEKDTQEELLALHEQARFLAELLTEWNDSHNQSLEETESSQHFIATELAAS